ncbi:hypothetical protein ABW19_dt0208762 [Dactylella cylindrospora]|nr:hypothetical protein ABW19_dt0208762 [Dactylella cylindrospora]
MRFETSNVQLAAAEKLQAEAKAAYRRGNYKVAIDKFTEAINMQPPILMALLDGRAAIYEKTEQLKPALNDAKTMMKHEKTNPKGYLRAGKVLHLMDKTTVAVDIYKLGLKHVAPSDPHIDLLKGMLEKALEKQNKAMQAAVKNRFDPMQVLPLELLEMVMEYVPFHNIVAMQRVSKTWQSVISSNARFWSLLDFSRAKKPVKRDALKNCIKKSKYTLTKAVINRIQGFNDTTLIDMVSMCKDLEYLRLMDGMFGSSLTHAMSLTKSIRILILNCLIPFTTLETLLNSEIPLEHLECWQLGPKAGMLKLGKREPCTTLKRVLINFAEADSKARDRLVALDELVEILPSVQELQLNKITCPSDQIDMTPLEKLEIFVCRNSKLSASSIAYPGSLRILDLACTTITGGANTAEHQETLRNLERLNVTKSNIPGQLLTELVPPFDNRLTHLRVGWSKYVGFHYLADNYLMKGSLSSLEELSIEGDFDFSNKSMASLYHLQHLKRLDASSTSVKGAGTYQLISNSKSNNLEEVVMNGVERVSEDLLKYASEQGVRIIQHQEGSRAWQLQQGENLSPFMKVWM